jgi:hypothetical protein
MHINYLRFDVLMVNFWVVVLCRHAPPEDGVSTFLHNCISTQNTNSEHVIKRILRQILFNSRNVVYVRYTSNNTDNVQHGIRTMDQPLSQHTDYFS